ncbi:very short patch repair endonuclease [Cereibacter johrii]|uniref:very short patch repair endonuclease n=1 Tax=Cereibacter johrii TaxID=445629 RepID=UPI003CEA0298
MADTRSPEQRRQIMRAVGTKNTGPELIVRSLLHAKGYRYRLHTRSLPGRPDIVFPARHKAIFVNGCFWHGHDCAKGRLPTSRLDYWGPKIEANVARDRRKLSELEALGWQTLVVWQCELKDIERVGSRLCAFLGPTKTDRQA